LSPPGQEDLGEIEQGVPKGLFGAVPIAGLCVYQSDKDRD
jgi:hypothetical protein